MEALIAQGKQAIAKNETEKLARNRAMKQKQREEAAKVRAAGNEALLHRVNETSSNAIDLEKRYVQELANNVKASTEYEFRTEIRGEVYENYDKIAEIYKLQIKDMTRALLEEELEPLVKAELAAKYEGEVKEQLANELQEAVRAEIRAEQMDYIKEELRAQLKPFVLEALRKQCTNKYACEGDVGPEVEANTRVSDDQPVNDHSTIETNRGTDDVPSGSLKRSFHGDAHNGYDRPEVESKMHVRDDQLTSQIDGGKDRTSTTVVKQQPQYPDLPGVDRFESPPLTTQMNGDADEASTETMKQQAQYPDLARVDRPETLPSTIQTNGEADEASSNIVKQESHYFDLTGVNTSDSPPRITQINGEADEASIKFVKQEPQNSDITGADHSGSPPPLSDHSSSRKRSRSGSYDDDDDDEAYDAYYKTQATKKLRSSPTNDYSAKPTKLEYSAFRSLAAQDYLGLGTLIEEEEAYGASNFDDGLAYGFHNEGGSLGVQGGDGVRGGSSYDDAGNLPNIQGFMSGMEQEEDEDSMDESEDSGEYGSDGELIERDYEGEELIEDDYEGEEPDYYDDGDDMEDKSSEFSEDEVEIAKIAALKAQGSSQNDAIALSDSEDEGEEDTTLVN